MIYTCKACGFSEGRGILPGSTCGLLICIHMGIASVPLLKIVKHIFPDGLGWWWLLGGPLLFVASLIVSYLIGLFVELMEWLLFCRKKCPICGKRKWSWGYVSGFGL